MNKIEELRTAIGLVGETSLLYFRSVIAAGATFDEAERLTKIYILSLIMSNNKEE